MKEYAKIVTSGKNTLISSTTISTTIRNLKVLDVGGGDGKRASLEFYPDSEVKVLDIKTGWDVMEYGLPQGDWDVILANHFIEHIDDPDYFLEECRKVMTHKTVLDIGTPNLNAWFNRLFFLFGYLPHSYEISYKKSYGKPFDWNKEEVGGHIRVMNVPSLIQLLKDHKFDVFSIEGEHSTFPCHFSVKYLDIFLTKLSPNLASAFRIKCRL